MGPVSAGGGRAGLGAGSVRYPFLTPPTRKQPAKRPGRRKVGGTRQCRSGPGIIPSWKCGHTPAKRKLQKLKSSQKGWK